jgi:hypothetical protein
MTLYFLPRSLATPALFEFEMASTPLPVLPPQRSFGETLRRDSWWAAPATVFIILGAFVVYATWAAFQNAHYTVDHTGYLSPFYSPEIWGDSPHSWFGPKPGWWPGLLPFSPALLILPFPGLFRFTCYYYRGAYYKAFWADPRTARSASRANRISVRIPFRSSSRTFTGTSCTWP